MQGLGLVEDVWKAWSNMVKGRALYQSVIVKLSNLLSQSVHSQALSSLVPQCPSKSQCMQAMVQIANNMMGYNMYRSVRFPRSAKNMVL